jgi:hypothetical protein
MRTKEIAPGKIMLQKLASVPHSFAASEIARKMLARLDGIPEPDAAVH